MNYSIVLQVLNAIKVIISVTNDLFILASAIRKSY